MAGELLTMTADNLDAGYYWVKLESAAAWRVAQFILPEKIFLLHGSTVLWRANQLNIMSLFRILDPDERLLTENNS